MTANNLVATNSIINHFYTQFKQVQQAYPSRAGICAENMDELKIENRMHLAGSYFVCASEIKVHPKKEIVLEGPDQQPGASLVAGRIVELKSSQIESRGTQDEPVMIVGLEGISITATELSKIKNLTLYLLEDAPLALNFENTSDFEDVQVVRLKLEGNQLTSRTEFNWKTYIDYKNSTRMIQEPSPT